MPLNIRASKKYRNLSLPISYKLGESDPSLVDASNVYSSQHLLNTRYGIQRWNSTSFGGDVLSLSYFVDVDSDKYILAKVAGVIYKAATSGAHTSLKTGLSTTTKHRGLTTNNRHIVATGSDGLWSYNGADFTLLGQDPPSAPSAAKAAGGSLADAEYQVALTYYASSTGFETNIGAASSSVTTETTNNTIDVSSIVNTAANAAIDKIRIYLKDVTASGAWLYITEIDLGTTTYSITANATSTQTPPTVNSSPRTGGGKYLTEFNGSLVYAGNSTYPNDVFRSEQFLPDAFDQTDTDKTISISGNGPITGVATGYLNNDERSQYLVITKDTSTHIYSEIGGIAEQIMISDHVGCPSFETMKVVNGDVFFMSEDGWRVISNGRFITDKDSNPITLGNGSIDDIFRRPGYTYEINKTQFDNCFSVYYPSLEQYITWVAEGSNTSFFKAYVYEWETKGFKVYDFPIAAKCTVLVKDSNNVNQVLFGGTNYIYEHSENVDRTDVDADNTAVNIDAYALINWIDGDDWQATHNFRDLTVRALTSTNSIEGKFATDFDQSILTNMDLSFPDPAAGFILDFSKLDEGVFSDGRTPVSDKIDINRTGENLLIGFYQNAANANMAIMGLLLDFSKNGNRNRM